MNARVTTLFLLDDSTTLMISQVSTEVPPEQASEAYERTRDFVQLEPVLRLVTVTEEIPSIVYV